VCQPEENRSRVGIVQHFYAKPSVASIELNGDVAISVGDVVAFRLRRKYHQARITSMQQNHTQVKQARHGKVGIVVDLNRHEMPIGSDVYLLPEVPNPEGAKASG
jgi:hypothetical protein